MEINNKLFFILVKKATLQVGPEVISPTEAATLAASPESGKLRDGTPTTLAMHKNEVDQLLVFFSSPGSFFDTKLVTARLPPHQWLSFELLLRL